MARATMDGAYRQLRGLLDGGSVAGLEDGQLLARFEADRDPAAFEALMGRHGPMVLSTCRAVLRDEHDAEDAFQATFLVLAKKAGSIRLDDSLGGWLHRVAYRASVQASTEARRRKRKEAEAALARERSPGPATDLELAALLHREIDRLPEAYRRPVVLCDLEGWSYDQAARQLGWTLPTLRNRLARARRRLKDRLAGRPEVAASGVAVVPAALARASLLTATGGTVPPGVALLTRILLRGMLMTRIKLASAGALAAVALASAGVMAVEGGRPPEGPRTAPRPKFQAAAQPEPAPPAPEQPGEMVEVQGRVIAADGKPVAGAAVRGFYFDRDAESFPSTTSGPDGRFALKLPIGSGLRARMAESTLLVASAPGHGVGWAERALRPDGPAEQVVTLAPEGPPIEGRIIDLEGRPVAGASVRTTAIWYDEQGQLPAWIARARNGAAGNLWQGLRHIEVKKTLKLETRADADGRFQLAGTGADRIAQLSVSGPGIATTEVHVFSRAEAEIRSVDRGMIGTMPFVVHAPKFQLALMPSQRVEGVARDKDSGAPIAGLLVWAAPFDASSLIPTPNIEATTDAEGRYRLDGLPRAAAYRLFIKPAKGLPYPNATLKAGARKAATEPVAFDFALKRGVVFRLRVVDKATGQPVLGMANYYALANNPNVGDYPGYSQSYEANAYPDVDGGYQIVVLPGRGLVTFRDEENRHLPATGYENLPGYEPRFDGFNVVPHTIPAKGQTILAAVEVDANAGPRTIDLQADPGKSATVEVVDPDGRPLGGTQVKGMSETMATVPIPQPSSGFEVNAIDPARPRRLVVIHEARKLIGSALLKGDQAAPILVKLQPWGTVAGRIVDAEGKPRKGMFLTSPGGSQNPHPETDDILPWTDWNSGVRVGDDGRFLIEGLVPGLKYAASARGRMAPNFDGGDLFEGLTVAPGEAKDLGDLKVKPAKPQE